MKEDRLRDALARIARLPEQLRHFEGDLNPHAVASAAARIAEGALLADMAEEMHARLDRLLAGPRGPQVGTRMALSGDTARVLKPVIDGEESLPDWRATFRRRLREALMDDLEAAAKREALDAEIEARR